MLVIVKILLFYVKKQKTKQKNEYSCFIKEVDTYDLVLVI